MNETEEKLELEIVKIKEPASVENTQVCTTTEEPTEIDENTVREPLFRVVVPKRRTWFYHFKYFLRGTRFVQALLGPQVKALPAPTQFKY